jgi:putative transcriptional regulator
MMTKVGQSILKGASEALAFAKGESDTGVVVHVPSDVDVRKIRRSLELSQEAFAAQFGFSLSAVRNWEQGRRQPEAAARAYLLVIKNDPDAVKRALEAA